MDLHVGQQIDRFRVEVEIGRGSIARVYKVNDRQSGRVYALKIFDESLARDKGFQRGVLDLSQESATKGQEGLVQMEEARLIDGLLALPMEYVVGGSLVGMLKQPPQSRRKLVQRLRLLASAAEALAVLHALGVPHGNLMPGNLLLSAPADDPSARLKLGDSSLSILASRRTGRLVGNPIYFAPECFKAQMSLASDIYGLGIVLYEAITGQPPFYSARMAEAEQKHLQEPPPPLSLFQPGLPSDLEALVLRCLAKNPAARFASSAELLSVLQHSIAALDPTPAPPPTPVVAPTIRFQGTAPAVFVYDGQRCLLNTYQLQPSETTVGRTSSNMIVLPTNDTAISRVHLLITWDGQQVSATDRSSNGTFRRDGTRLALRVSEVWPWNEELRIDEFILVLHPPSAHANDPLIPIVEPNLPAVQAPTQLIATPATVALRREGWLRRILRRVLS